MANWGTASAEDAATTQPGMFLRLECGLIGAFYVSSAGHESNAEAGHDLLRLQPRPWHHPPSQGRRPGHLLAL